VNFPQIVSPVIVSRRRHEAITPHRNSDTRNSVTFDDERQVVEKWEKYTTFRRNERGGQKIPWVKVM
jgi:hypothetical protein